ncbi:MAG: AfsR/SARP family transcriptional regulator [Brevundimonas sp.]
MQTLRVQLFGHLKVAAGSGAAVRFPTRKSRALLAYVALKRERRANRLAVVGDLWPESDEERAHRALNTELWRLKTALRDSGADPAVYLDTDHETVGFKAGAAIWCDVRVFDDATRSLAVLSERDGVPDRRFLVALAEAVALYNGDLLEGIYDDWCLVHRESYRARLVAALEHLVQARMEAREWDEAIAFGQRLIAIDPLLEHVHRALMRCHYIKGNRPAALKQFAACATALRRDLRVEPMDETRQVYETMIALPGRAPPVTGVRVAPAGEVLSPSRTPIEKIDLALANLYAAQGWLEDAGRGLRRRAAD